MRASCPSSCLFADAGPPVCVCVFMYIYSHVCMYVCMYIHVKICLFKCVCRYTYALTYTHTHAHARAHTHTHTHAIHTPTHMHMYIYLSTDRHVQTQTQTHTHTHTRDIVGMPRGVEEEASAFLVHNLLPRAPLLTHVLWRRAHHYRGGGRGGWSREGYADRDCGLDC